MHTVVKMEEEETLTEVNDGSHVLKHERKDAHRGGNKSRESRVVPHPPARPPPRRPESHRSQLDAEKMRDFMRARRSQQDQRKKEKKGQERKGPLPLGSILSLSFDQFMKNSVPVVKKEPVQEVQSLSVEDVKREAVRRNADLMEARKIRERNEMLEFKKQAEMRCQEHEKKEKAVCVIQHQGRIWLSWRRLHEIYVSGKVLRRFVSHVEEGWVARKEQVKKKKGSDTGLKKRGRRRKLSPEEFIVAAMRGWKLRRMLKDKEGRNLLREIKDILAIVAEMHEDSSPAGSDFESRLRAQLKGKKNQLYCYITGTPVDSIPHSVIDSSGSEEVVEPSVDEEELRKRRELVAQIKRDRDRVIAERRARIKGLKPNNLSRSKGLDEENQEERRADDEKNEVGEKVTEEDNMEEESEKSAMKPKHSFLKRTSRSVKPVGQKMDFSKVKPVVDCYADRDLLEKSKGTRKIDQPQHDDRSETSRELSSIASDDISTEPYHLENHVENIESDNSMSLASLDLSLLFRVDESSCIPQLSVSSSILSDQLNWKLYNELIKDYERGVSNRRGVFFVRRRT